MVKDTDRSEHSLSLGIIVGSVSRRAGGLFNAVRDLALHLIDTGVTVEVYGGRDRYSDQDFTSWQPIRPHVLDVVPPTKLGYAPLLRRMLNAGHHDLLHLHGIWQLFSLDVLRWRHATGRPVVISPHGMLDPWALGNSVLKKRVAGALFERRNLAAANCLHALTISEADALRNYGLASPIAIIPNGTVVPQLAAAAPAVRDQNTLLFLGRIHPKKGINELLYAWAKVRTINPDLAEKWRLVIAGWDDGGYLAELEAKIAVLNVGNSVEFSGPVFGETKDRLLSSVQAFILPSYSEGLPMSVLGAWAYGLPVLMTRMCNLPMAFELGAALEISTDPEAMACSLAASLGRADLATIGRRGRMLVEAEFSWDQIAAKHKSVYEWLCGQADRPACVSTD